MKGIAIGQYYPGESLVHKLDPRLKLYTVMLFILSIFFIKHFVVYAPIALLILSIIWSANIPVGMVLKSLRTVIVIVLATLILNVFLTPGEIIFQYWFLKVTKEGIKLGLFMGTRIVLLILGTTTLTLTTSPIALADGLEYAMKPLEKIKFPSHEIAMMMTISLRFIPTILEEMDKIIKAQTSRGADFESGNLLNRVKNLIPLLVPLFISAFRRADELAIAMEARCYRGGKGRTKMNTLKYTKTDYMIKLFVTLFFGSIILIYFIF